MVSIRSTLTGWLSQYSSTQTAPSIVQTDYFENQLSRIRAALETLEGREAFDVLFFSHRKEYFDTSDIRDESENLINSLTFCDSEAELMNLDRNFHIAIACTHIHRDHLSQLIMRARGLASLIVAWTWDNHHRPFENLCSNSLVDIVVPAHNFCSDELKSPHYVLGKSLPLCTAQWSRSMAQRLLMDALNMPRSEAL